METLVFVFSLFIAALGLVAAIIAGIAGHRGRWAPWKTGAILLVCLIFVAIGTASATISVCRAQQATEADEKDFYQIQWEKRTPEGTTAVVAEDSQGRQYVGEFQGPLGVKKVLVVGKDRFRPLLPPPEKKAPTKTGN